MEKDSVTIFWFRRDLRLEDNAGLYHAFRSGLPVVPVFIFDKLILDKLENKEDKRVNYIYDALEEIQEALVQLGSTLHCLYGEPLHIFSTLVKHYTVQAVYTNHDYEPYAAQRDNTIQEFLQHHNITFHTYKDQVIFEKDEVVKDNKEPYTVFTPYCRKWKDKLNEFYLRSYPTKKYFSNFYKQDTLPLPTLSEMGFKKTESNAPEIKIKKGIIEHYNQTRDFPGLNNGTSRMGVHLRFGTVSIRKLAIEANQLNETYLNELIWRDFYHMILWNYPHVGMGKSFKTAYDNIIWRNNEEEFERWCKGLTGYPIVDAGMRELNATGYMHNRVRMIVASFLIKHLLIDWRWGEAYFAEKLLDFDLAANNGGWQWAAGSGCDAAPYFRVFNPYLQTNKFDKDLTYIKKWIPELNEFSYPQPIVQHEFARKRALEVYANALKPQ